MLYTDKMTGFSIQQRLRIYGSLVNCIPGLMPLCVAKYLVRLLQSAVPKSEFQKYR